MKTACIPRGGEQTESEQTESEQTESEEAESEQAESELSNFFSQLKGSERDRELENNHV